MRHSISDRAYQIAKNARFKATGPRMRSPPAIKAVWTSSSHGGTYAWTAKLQL